MSADNIEYLSPDTLKDNASDYITTTAKASLGMVPLAGSFLAEIAGVVIPNQRIERLVKFAIELQKHVERQGIEIWNLKIQDENFTELIEESMRQAARTTTEKRRERIAKIVANSVAANRIDVIQSRHLLRVLGDINDIEILWLLYFDAVTIGDRDKVAKSHPDVFKYVLGFIPNSVDKRDAIAINESYGHHLYQLGLCEQLFRTDETTGTVKVEIGNTIDLLGYKTTAFGKLLLRQLDLINDEGVWVPDWSPFESD